MQEKNYEIEEPMLWEQPRQVGPIEENVKKVITDLEEQKLLRGKHLATAATCLSMAAAVDKGMLGGPKGVSVATAHLARLLMESIDTLPEPDRGQDEFYDALDAQLQALTEEALV
jgi:hypothetical protein|nr:MAG TPA: hypothetical protein [Caudoviricetes sp.]